MGCDSIVTLNLTIRKSSNAIDTQEACDSFTWIDGITYTESTDNQIFTLSNASGCDSIVTLHLTVRHATVGDTIVTACDSFTWHGVTYTETPTIAPIFTIEGGSAVGCDSIVTLHLTVHQPQHAAFTVDACETYDWNGSTYTQSGTYNFSHQDANGCTQVDTLHLTIHTPVHDAVTVEACAPYPWNGQVYTEAGDYTFAHPDGYGCEQVDTLHLIFLDPFVEIVPRTRRFCDEGSAVLEVQTDLADYEWSTGETTPAITVYEEGIYTVTASQGECVVEAEYTLKPCEHDLLLPNAFSPDGDGLNDEFYIPEAYHEQINDYGFSVRIYNRWGEAVYSATDKRFRWNGEINGRVYHHNVYNYVIEYRTWSGVPRQIRGSVTVR